MKVGLLAGALALGVRVPLIVTGGELVTRFTSANDVWGYHELAKNLAERGTYAYGDHLTAYRPPLYPLFLSGIYRVAGISFPAARLAQSVFFLALLPITFAIGRRIVGERGAEVACVVTAIYPIFVHYSTEILSESVAVVLVPLCYLAFLRAYDTPSLLNGILLGAASAGALMSRPILLPTVAGMAGLLFLNPDRRVSAAQVAASVAAMAGVVTLVFAPWILRNEALFGAFIPFGNYGGFALYEGVTEYRTSDWETHKALLRSDLGIHRVDFERPNPTAIPDEVALDHRARALALHEIRERPLRFLQSVATHAEVTFIGIHEDDLRSLSRGRPPLTLIAGTLPYWLVLAGALAMLRRRGGTLPAGARFLLLMVVLCLLPTLAFSGAIRYRAPTLDLLLIVLASGLVRGDDSD